MKIGKRLMCTLIIFVLLNQSMIVFAEDVITEEEQERIASYAVEPDSNKLTNWPSGPAVYADSAIVMDIDSGAILYSKNIDKQQYPASITKLLTTLVALENASLTDSVSFSENCVSFLEYGDAQIGMKPGEILTLEDALYAVLLASANEVSYAVGESVGTQNLGGNYDTFLQKMNDRARELGCYNSNWVNTNGLHDAQHYTTAYDMALIASALYQQQEFLEIMKSMDHRIGFTNITNEERVFQQNHRMLLPGNMYYYEKSIGGKTGYTDQAKTTLVTMADDGNMRLVAVVLYDYGVEVYNDTRALFEYGFSNFNKKSLTELTFGEDILQVEENNPFVVLPKELDLSQINSSLSLTGKGIRDGELLFDYEGQKVGNISVIVSESGYKNLTEESSSEGNIADIVETETEKIRIKSIILVGAMILFLIIAFSIMKMRIKVKRKRKNR